MQQNSNYGGGQHKRNRYSQGGGGHHHGNRPRKNYGASREKYLAQARDALASGDRVLAENFYQHADHCYRMMMEENQNRPPQQQQHQQPRGSQLAQPSENTGNEQADLEPTSGNTALPAFLTSGYTPEQPGNVPVQNWEERDEA